jgi:hypothetical protein
MADYYPLIARAVAGLDKNTGDVRRALYERARTALVTQLRSTNPPLNETDITRERLALEEAIRSVEGEAARRPRETPHADLGAAGGADAETRASDFEAKRAGGEWQSLSDRGLKGFRDTVGEAENLGGAAAKATESAREVYDAIPPAPSLPSYGADGPSHSPNFPPRSADFERFEPRFERDSARQIPPDAALPRPLDPDELSDMERAPRAPRSALPPYEDLEESHARPQRSYRGVITIVVLLVIIGGLAAAAYWQRNTLMSLYALVSGPSAPVVRETAPSRAKIADRVGGGAQNSTARPGAAPAASVAQKVVLYEEDASDTQGKRAVGSALWRTETVSPGPGLAPELAIRADVEIPERKVRMTWSLRRNTDKALPASHTIEILFTLPADFPEGGIANVPGVLMKQGEQTRGVPLAGLAVKVTNGFFLIGLSAVDVDLQRNVQMLKERSWFDIPVVYNNGKRAILAVEKGTPGERVFEEAFRAWGQ